MKITNWRKKLAITLATCGMISPSAALAANLNSDLVVNGGFEDVTFSTTGGYGAPKIQTWLGGPAFAYSHDGTSGIPNYANGTAPANSGHWFFTSNNNPNGLDYSDPNLVYQDIDVSTGDTATAIAAGKGRVDVQAFMSTYATNLDAGIVQVDFLDSGGASQGAVQILDSDLGHNNEWSQNNKAAPIYVGTNKLRVSIYGRQGNGGVDGYIDNVEVKVNQTAANQLLTLEVNTITGQMAIKNETGASVKLDYYEIASAGNRLSPIGWNSLQDPGSNPAGFPSGNGSGNGWEESGGSSAGVLSESYLTDLSTADNGANIGLGAGFLTGGAQDLAFRYGTPSQPLLLLADYNTDQEVDGGDILISQRHLGDSTPPDEILKAMGNSDFDSDVDATDFAQTIDEFGTAAATRSLVRGVVRYVTSGPITAIPEPCGALLAGIGIASLAQVRRNRPDKS